MCLCINLVLLKTHLSVNGKGWLHRDAGPLTPFQTCRQTILPACCGIGRGQGMKAGGRRSCVDRGQSGAAGAAEGP